MKAGLLVPTRKFYTSVQMTGGQILGIEFTKVQAENSHLASKLRRKSWLTQTTLTRTSSGSRENFWLAFYHS